MLYAAEPTLPGTNTFKRNNMRTIGSVPGLPAGGTDITALYTHTWRAAQASEKVAVKLVGVSANGQRTGDYFLSGVTTALVAEAAGSPDAEDEALHLQAA